MGRGVHAGEEHLHARGVERAAAHGQDVIAVGLVGVGLLVTLGLRAAGRHHLVAVVGVALRVIVEQGHFLARHRVFLVGFLIAGLGREGLAVEQRRLAILLAAQIGAQGEDVLGRVLVHRGVGRGAHHDDGVRRVADHEHEHAQQRGVHQALTHNVLPVFLVEHQGRQTADNKDADDDGHQAVAHEEGDTQQRHRQYIEHVGQRAAGCGGGPDGGEHHGDEQQDIDDEAGVEAKAQHVDKEQFKPTAHLHDAGHDAIEHGHDEQHGHAEGGQRTFGVGLRLLVVVIDQDDGRQAQQVEQVHADGQAGEVEDKHQIAVGVGLVGMLFPLEDEPEYQRGKHRRIGIHLTLDGREPERVAPRIGQGACHAGGDDRHHLPQALHLAAGTHQLARQVRDAPEEEQDAEGREQRRHDVDTVGHVGRVVSKLCEEVGRQHEEGCAGRVSHFQFVARGDKLGAVPEARGGLHRKAVGDGRHQEDEPARNVVDQFVLFHFAVSV